MENLKRRRSPLGIRSGKCWQIIRDYPPLDSASLRSLRLGALINTRPVLPILSRSLRPSRPCPRGFAPCGRSACDWARSLLAASLPPRSAIAKLLISAVLFAMGWIREASGRAALRDVDVVLMSSGIAAVWILGDILKTLDDH